jgi:hypothetical protein
VEAVGYLNQLHFNSSLWSGGHKISAQLLHVLCYVDQIYDTLLEIGVVRVIDNDTVIVTEAIV